MSKIKKMEIYAEKSYQLLLLWLIGLILAIIGFALFGRVIGAFAESSEMFKMMLLIAAFMIWLLYFIILKSERIYYIYGMRYEKAKVIGSQKRKLFAHSHLRVFSFATLLYAMVGALSTVFAWPFMTDLSLFLFIYGLAVVRSSKIKI